MVDHPFGPPVPSVALSPNSLVFVVAQLRFPPVVSINEDGFVGPFQELIRSEYPNLEKAVEAQITLSPDGVHRTEGGVLWKFSTSDSSWHVALTSSFVAVSTSAYSNRNEFLTRLDFVVSALEQWLRPRRATRFGIRYVDRLEGEDLDRLAEFVRAEVLGVSLIEPGNSGVLGHVLTESVYRLDDLTLRARHGRLPAGTSLDPSVPATNGPSWVCDLDASIENIDFDRSELLRRAAGFGDVIYRYYRWAMTSEFIRAHGGDLG